MKYTLLKNGLIYNFDHDKYEKKDILIKDKKIVLKKAFLTFSL